MSIRSLAPVICCLGLVHCSAGGGGQCRLPTEQVPGQFLCQGVCIDYVLLYSPQHCGQGDQCVKCPDPVLPHTVARCFTSTGVPACGWECDPGYHRCGDPWAEERHSW